ncbi:SRPBCC family protein [Rubrivirga sp.]|uniref:SRPBCC family protein n=1 Tax=Rubrivirga sp. TaxID=1885344 RepID=UPI003B525A72
MISLDTLLRRPLGRGPYLATGLGLFAVKYLADRVVSEGVFGRPWDLWSYLDVTGAGRILSLTPETRTYALSLVAMALPFIAVGTWLTVRRLRTVGLPPWLVVLFFVPVVNLVLFTALSIAPDGPAPNTTDDDAPTWLERVVPEGRLGSAALAVAATAVGALGVVWVSADALASYGWGLFVGVPFALGMAAAMLYQVHGPREMSEAVGVACLAVTLLAAGIAVVALEGVICLVMAAPIAYALASLGAVFGHLFASGGLAIRPALWAVGVVPALVGVEAAAPPVAPLTPVTTAVEIAAPPDVVWRHVVAFSDLPAPDDWVFGTGIAYPVRATIDGSGVGAVRRCEFTTGAFVEPITVWEPGRRLAFDVLEQPAPMRERGLFGDVHAPHLDGYFVSERGQFLLTALPGGRTRLEGTTWYRHRIWPSAYWRLWSDAVLHRIHGRVLDHVRTLAEA